jgi:hypothetical protein
MEKITRNICLKWNVEEFGEGSETPIPIPGDGYDGFVISTEEKWSFYSSMRRFIGLDNIKMIFIGL